jgi:uncharacterized protein
MRIPMQPQLLFSPLANQVRKVLALIVLVLAASTPTWTLASEAPQTQLPRTRIQAGMHFIDAQVAQSPAEMEVGLMHRKSMPANEGMLFVFPDRQPRCFWMKNTLMPLTIAFLADDGTILQTADMKAGSLDSHCSKEAVRYALEMNLGWFKQRGISPGTRLLLKQP